MIMKKSTFITMLLGTLGGLLFALGMCMTLIKEWNTFAPGLVFSNHIVCMAENGR